MKHIWNWLAMKSDAGIGLLLINIIAMFWVCLITVKPIPEGLVTIVLGIFTAKTAHGVLTHDKK